MDTTEEQLMGLEDKAGATHFISGVEKMRVPEQWAPRRCAPCAIGNGYS